MTKKNKAALYVRVSTKDKQETKNQIQDLKEYCERSGLTVTEIYEDNSSGGNSKRAGFQKMLLDAHQKKFDILIFWALDRFSREGVLDTLKHLEKLDNAGVSYRSYSEPLIASDGIYKDLVVSLFSIMAKQERVRMSDRVKSGMRRAKEEGRRVSRPSLDPVLVKKIKELLSNGLSMYKVSKKLNISPSTVSKYKKGI